MANIKITSNLHDNQDENRLSWLSDMLNLKGLTNAEISALTPIVGDLVRNAQDGVFQWWDGTQWVVLGGGGAGNLQEVTDLGNTTTNNITLTDGVNYEMFLLGSDSEISAANSNGSFIITTERFEHNNNIGQAIFKSDIIFMRNNIDNNEVAISMGNVLGTRQHFLPNGNGTYALSVNGISADLNGNITVPIGAGLTNAENGLYPDGNIVRLGGSLSEHTSINGNNYQIEFGSIFSLLTNFAINHSGAFSSYGRNYLMMQNEQYSTIITSNATAGLLSLRSMYTYDPFGTSEEYEKSITLETLTGLNQGVIVKDTIDNIGLIGDVDFSPNYTPLSYVQKTYVDRKAIITRTSNYTVTLNDYAILCNTNLADITITLPAASTMNGRIFCIKKIASANQVIVNPNLLETIDGSPSQVITAIWTNLTIISNGSNWFIL